MDFTFNLKNPTETFPHFWEHTVGSCHASMALRADYQKQLARCSAELGFRFVRFHGLLSDDMGTLVNENGKLIYSFYNADQICDFLLSIGMRPFMELSFMPSALSSGDGIVFHYQGNVTPPHDYSLWQTLINKLVKHLAERYGLEEVSHWFFEVWNEPNLSAFWKGTQADYFKLYECTVKAIKSVHAALKVGGPATANNKWIPEFLDFCEQNNVPVDFISTHQYPNDNLGQPGDDTVAQLAASTRSALKKEVEKAKEETKGKPLYYTEWCTSSNPFDQLHDEPYAAAFIIKTIMEARGLVDGYSYWTFSDLFEENYFCSDPFHGGFGLMNIYGIPKPAYRAFELLHRAGNEILKAGGGHDTVDVWLTRERDALTISDTVTIFVTNWALPLHNIKTETVTILLSEINTVRNAYLERIDDTHANAREAWVAMGKPGSLMPHMVEKLEWQSSLIKEAVDIHYDDNSITITLTILPQTSACITLELNEQSNFV